MSRSRPFDLASFLNCQLICLREEINAEQWKQTRRRLEHMKALVDQYSPIFKSEE